MAKIPWITKTKIFHDQCSTQEINDQSTWPDQLNKEVMPLILPMLF